MIIHVVVEDGGGYDDRWTCNRFAYLKLEDAEKCLAEQVAYIAKHKLDLVKLHEFFVQYVAEYKQPIPNSRAEIPRWPSGMGKKDITQEMRDERKRLEEINRDANAEFAERNQRYWKAMYDAQCKFAMDNGIDIQQSIIMSPYFEETSWSIEQLQVLSEFIPTI